MTCGWDPINVKEKGIILSDNNSVPAHPEVSLFPVHDVDFLEIHLKTFIKLTGPCYIIL